MAQVQTINMDAAVQGWAEVAIDRFKEALKKEGVHEFNRDLINSLVAEVSRNGGDIDKVILKFKSYGRFVDMGVGRGVAIGKRGTGAFDKNRRNDGKLKKYGRKAKPWYSRTKTREVSILRQILITQYGIQTLATIENGLTFTDNETLL